MSKGGNKQPSIDASEHIGPDDTGDNIDAKRVAGYVYNPATGKWQRNTLVLTPGADYDYIDVQQTSSTVESYVYMLGGSGGTAVQTVTVTYTDDTKAILDNIAWS